MSFVRALPVLAAISLLGACAAPEKPPASSEVAPRPEACPACPPCPPVGERPKEEKPHLRPARWGDLPGWTADDAAAAWEPFLRSCGVLGPRDEAWRAPCEAAAGMSRPGAAQVRGFFESRFDPWQVVNGDGGTEGLVTGYYEPLLRGSRSRSARYAQPLYGVPDDLLVVDLAGLYPELRHLRLRGRIDGNRVVPYYSRAEIENGASPRRHPLLWVEDPVELFFLQIQGSGRVLLENGETVRVGYADQNGHPYRSLGRHLVERGELQLEKASMQGIKAWAREHPGRLREALDHNASYVFFRELPGDLPGPPGALGVPLAAGRSIAVDPRTVPLGAPVFLATTDPGSGLPLDRLVMAQDTGGAIKGGVRADFFWGFGAEAGEQAGRMKQPGRMWVLMPRGITPRVNN